MHVEISLENNGHIPAGVDWGQLAQGVKQNVESFAQSAEGKIKETRVPPPDTAQGEDLLIQWAIEVAKDPKMAIVYYKMLCFGINELLTLAKGKQQDKGTDETISTRIKVLGKEIRLPTAVTAIEEFLKSLG